MEEIEDKTSDPVSPRLREIKLALEKEKGWRKEAEKADKIYRGERRIRDESDKPTFNILWANVDIKRQAIYNNTPTPDIRKRFKEPDPVSDAVSELLERAVTYVLDCKDVDSDLIHATNDMLVPGRAVLRVRYKSEVEEVEGDIEGETYETVGTQEVELEPVQYDEFFIVGKPSTWADVYKIGFIHKLRKEEVQERWPDYADQIKYESVKIADESEVVYKEATVYELWEKEGKKVYWIAKDFTDSFLETEDDPMELKGFWPIAKPLYAIESTTSLIPQTEYSKYEVLAEELETVSYRLNMVANAIRVRGVYDQSLSEIEKVLDAGDNELIPAENVSMLLERGGLEKAIWMLPIEMLVNVRQILGQQRNDLIGQIYEITGISDIVRGNTNPNETASAQKIKANFGSMRLEKQKQALNKFARDTIRLVVEIIAENYTRDNLSMMTGLNFPTMIEKQLAQMDMQQAQIMQQEPPQQLQEILNKPSWEEIEQVLQSDLMRDYRVDIETDSTIAQDVQKEQQTMTEYLQGMGAFLQHAGMGLQTGMLSQSGAKALMKSFARKFKLGREVEDELETEDPPRPDPEQQKMQMEMQMEQQKFQMEMQGEQQKAQMEAQASQMELQMKQREMEMKLQEAQAKMEIEREKLALERQKLEIERQSLAMKAQAQVVGAEIEQEKLANKSAYEKASHQMKMEKASSESEVYDYDPATGKLVRAAA